MSFGTIALGHNLTVQAAGAPRIVWTMNLLDQTRAARARSAPLSCESANRITYFRGAVFLERSLGNTESVHGAVVNLSNSAN